MDLPTQHLTQQPATRNLAKRQTGRIVQAALTRFKLTLERIWQWVVCIEPNRYEPRVWCTYDDYGNIVWSAYDPITGITIQQVSETEMKVWIETRHHRHVHK